MTPGSEGPWPRGSRRARGLPQMRSAHVLAAQMTPAATIPVDQSLLRTFTSIKIAYPEGRETSREEQRVYEPINNRVTYRLIDRDARRSSDREPLSVLGMRQERRSRSATTPTVTRPTFADGEGLARLASC